MSEAREPSEIDYRVGSHFSDPAEVVDDRNLSHGEKQALLEDWRFRLDARVARAGTSDVVRRRHASLDKALDRLDAPRH
jgi:hypothetical protein